MEGSNGKTRPLVPGNGESIATTASVSSAEKEALTLRKAADAALRATAAARDTQDKFVDVAAQHPALSRFSREYIRGATEFFFAAVGLGAVAWALRCGLVRYRVETDIPPRLLRRRATLHGYVMRVTDGDGLRFYHTPWLRRLLFPDMKRIRKVSSETINVRLAGVDAPEVAHYGAPGQKYGKEARSWLKQFAEQRRASLQLHKLDQYSRVLGTVHLKRDNVFLRIFGLGRKNLSLELTKAGYAVVYKGANAEYGGLLKHLQNAQATAMRRRIGMWQDKNVISPAEYKAKLREGFYSNGKDLPGTKTNRGKDGKPSASAIFPVCPFGIPRSVLSCLRDCIFRFGRRGRSESRT